MARVIQQAPEPTSDFDIATKKYVDDNAGGGGGGATGASAAASYLRANKLLQQLNPVLNDAVIWDNLVDSAGDVSLNVSNGQVTIPAGRTFHLKAEIFCGFTSAFIAYFEWYDVTNAATVDGSRQTNRSTTATGQLSSTTTSCCTVKPLVDTVYECRLVGAFTAGLDILGANTGEWGLATNLEVFELGATSANVIGGLEFMDIIEVTSPVASVTFGEGGDGAFGRALDGDLDEVYELEFFWPKPNTTLATLEVHPNGVDVGASSSWERHLSNGSTSEGSGWALAVLGSAGTGTDLFVSGNATIYAKTGKRRVINAESTGGPSSVANVIGCDIASQWHDDSTKITSLEIINEAANLPAGTRLVLYRRTRANLRVDSAATFDRGAEPTVNQGTAAEVDFSLGGATFNGSAIGISAELDDTVTGGSITVRLKVGGSTVLTTVLDTTNPTRNVARAAVGTHKFNPKDALEVSVETSALVTTGGGVRGLTVFGSFTNSGLYQPARPMGFESQLWVHPEEPSAYDDEFDSDTLDTTKWQDAFANGIDLVTPPAARAAFSSSNIRVAANRRASWLTMQNSSDSVWRGISQDINGGQVPVGVYYARIKDLWSRQSIVNSDGQRMFGLFEDDGGGNPNLTNYVAIQIEPDAGTFTYQAVRGGGAGTIRDTGQMQGVGVMQEYFFINYDGTNYDMYMAGSDGCPIHFSSFTHGSVLRHVGLIQFNVDQTPWNQMVMCDFIRYEANPEKLGF